MTARAIVKKTTFKEELENELNQFVSSEYNKYPKEDLLKMDLHCHDYNSDKPDELLGRILNVPETWLKSEKLIKVLKKHGCEAFCISNHNNARSCYEMQSKGHDILNAAEFTCIIPEYNIFIHVLTYGFTEEQENDLNLLRRNLHQFLFYCKENDIPTIWAHPLYNYYAKKMPDLEFFFKLSLLFERFEVINGQRETWQNLLVKNWIEGLTPEKIDQLANQYQIDIHKYCKNPYKKSFSGGSDSHMGIFSGLTGSYLYIPNLQKRLKEQPASELALEAIKKGDMIPYGSYTRHEKLVIAFLDYFCQIAMNYQDPGLMRIILHKGTTKDKVTAFMLSNVVAELQHNKTTMSFIKIFQKSIQGSAPSYLKKYLIPKHYKPVFADLKKLAIVNQTGSETLAEDYQQVLHEMYKKLNKLFLTRLGEKANHAFNAKNKEFDINKTIEMLDLPSKIRDVSIKGNKKNNSSDHFDMHGFLDGLSFPFLSSSIILAANYTSAKVLFNHRELLNSFSAHIGKLKHPERMLWLTDTFDDKNGVSVVLQSIHKLIKTYDLPIDILVCSETVKADNHLIVIKPVNEIKHPLYPDQTLRLPDFMEVHALFDKNEYDRVMCSTEGPMGLAALYLKNAFSVKAHFYMHTDWLIFGKNALNLKKENLSRLRRALRSYYKMFDQVFVLNTEHFDWLTGSTMSFKKNQVAITAHWIEDYFTPQNHPKQAIYYVEKNDKVMLYVGRISREKGVMEIPEIFEKLTAKIKNLKMVFIGTGPEEKLLKEMMPKAIFYQWLDHKELPDFYSAADLLLFPSKFDTFSCVVLEAMSCGLPVLAYKTKGPADIIEHKKSGLLAKSQAEMVKLAVEYFEAETVRSSYRKLAIKRAKKYEQVNIFNQLLKNVQLDEIKPELTAV